MPKGISLAPLFWQGGPVKSSSHAGTRGGSRRVKKSGSNGGGGGRREAGVGGFPTPARALGSRGGKYLPLRGWLGSCEWHVLPVVGFKVVELIELEADVLDGELQQIPETSQVLGRGPWVGVHILHKGGWHRDENIPTLYTWFVGQ